MRPFVSAAWKWTLVAMVAGLLSGYYDETMNDAATFLRYQIVFTW